MGATVVFVGFFTAVGLALLYVFVGIGIGFLREVENDPFSLRQLFLIWLGIAFYLVFIIFVGLPRMGTDAPATTAVDAIIFLLTFVGFIVFMFALVMTFVVGLLFGAMVFVAFPFYAVARLTKIISDRDVGKASYL